MSPVPAFDQRGFLPPFIGNDGTTGNRSPYVATMVELVASLGTTDPRRELVRGLLDYRQLLERLGYTLGFQYIDGSFVEDVEAREGRPPGDIDVFGFLVRPQRYQQDQAQWIAVGFPEWNSEIVDFTVNKRRFKIDTYAIAVDQVGPLDLIAATTYWSSLFAHKRITHDWKGFLQILLNPADDAAARALL
jgi:hypothetical protein